MGADLLQRELGDSGVVLAVGLAGFADAQSAAISAASLVADGRLEADAATVPILVALTTNTVTKLVLAVTLGRRRFATAVGAGLLVVLGALWAGLLVG